MGDAKRRKQLGLMPTIHPFEVEVDQGGTLSFTQQPEGEAERSQITTTLKRMLPVDAHWDQAYRTTFVMAGLPEKLLDTREDVETIPVPPRRRLLGELAIWPGPPREEDPNSVKVEGTENTWLHFRSRQHAFENGPWSSLPVVENFEEMLGYLMQHPVLNVGGEVVGSYAVEQMAGGELRWTPEPPEAVRAGLIELARDWHGETPEEWLDFHAERLGDDEHPDAATPPRAIRSTFELREPAPLQPLFDVPLDVFAGLDVYTSASEQVYSLDGETWRPYPLAEPGEGAGLFDDSIDLETVEVIVWDDGRVEWPEGEFPDDQPEDQAERLRASLRDFTGAGDPVAWAEYSRTTLSEYFGHELELSPQSELPALRGVKLDVPADLPDEGAGTDGENDLQMLFFENYLSFDGETWRDVEDELPPELSRFAPAGSAARTIDMPSE